MIKIERFNLALISLSCLLPLFLVTGPFLPDLLITLMGILFFFGLIYFKNLNYLNNFFFKYSLIICSYLIITSLLSSNILLSFESTLPFIRLIFLVLVFNYLLNIKSNFIKFFSISCISIFVFILIDSIFQKIFGVNFFLSTINDNQISSVFGSERILGSYVSRILPIIIGFLILLNINRKKIFYYILIISFISLLIILFSGERTALINFISLFFFIILFNIYNLRNIFLKLLIPFIILISLIVLIDDKVRNRLITTTISELKFNDSWSFLPDHHRLHYISAILIFKDNFIIGSGPKLFRKLCKDEKYYVKADDIFNKDDYVTYKLPLEDMFRPNIKRTRFQELNGCSTHPHHTHIQILTETGLIGYFLFLSTICLIIFYIFKTKNNTVTSFDFNLLMLSTILLNFTPFTPSGNFFNNWLSIIYFLPIALISFNKNIFKVNL